MILSPKPSPEAWWTSLTCERLGDFLKAWKLAAEPGSHSDPVTLNPESLKCHRLTRCARTFLDHRKDRGLLFWEESETCEGRISTYVGVSDSHGGERQCAGQCLPDSAAQTRPWELDLQIGTGVDPGRCLLGCYHLSSAGSAEAMNNTETEDRFVRLGDPQRPGLCSCPFSVPSNCLGGPELLVMQLPELPDHPSISITMSRSLLKTANITSRFWTFENIHSFYKCLLSTYHVLVVGI